VIKSSKSQQPELILGSKQHLGKQVIHNLNTEFGKIDRVLFKNEQLQM